MKKIKMEVNKMLEQIYYERKEEIDKTIKKALQNIEASLIKIDNKDINENSNIYNILEENYNIKLSSICKEIYLQGFKDGINLMLEVKEK